MDQQPDEKTLVELAARLAKDKNYEDALIIDWLLVNDYPDNPVYKTHFACHLSWAGNAYDDNEALALAYYEEAITIDPKYPQAYNNRGAVWNNQKDYVRAVQSYSQAIALKDDDPDFYKNRGDSLYELKDYSGAERDYTTAIELNEKASPGSKKEFANIFNDRGLARMGRYKYREAIGDYLEALSADGGYVYAHHNLYLAYSKIGCYADAYTHLEQARDGYEQLVESAEKAAAGGDSGGDLVLYYQYLAELCLYSYTDDAMIRIEPYIQKGLQRLPDSWDLNVTAIKYYTAKKYLVCEDDASRDKLSIREDKVLVRQNECLRLAGRHYKVLCDIFAANALYQADRDKMAELAGIHLLFDESETAEKLYEQALVIQKDHVSSLVGKGVALAGRKKYDESIICFRKAALLDMDDLNIQSNLAEAYFRSGCYTEAEKIYKKILALAGHNEDATIGLGELFKTMGDQAREKNKKTDAEDYYKWAEEWYGKAIEWQAPFKDKTVIPSKRLSLNDLASIQYSTAYIHCCLYELTATTTFQDRGLLRTARSSFRNICKGTDDYYKARASIRKIDKALETNALLTTRAGAWSVIGLAILLLLAAQFAFFFRGQHTTDDWFISSAALKAWTHANKTQALYPLLSKMADTPFSSPMAIGRYLHTILGEKDSLNLPDITAIATAVQRSSESPRLLSEASYIAISFGCLIFIIAGFFMGQISKLKVAGLELEKNVIDQINTNLPSLGISD